MILTRIIQILLCVGLIEVHSTSLPKKLFRCKNGNYISELDFCNTFDDCQDGSDEGTGCDWLRCGRGLFTCNVPRRCRPVSIVCDGAQDCPDGSDEWNCAEEDELFDCSSSDAKFLCKDRKRCLNFENICDGFCNCIDCSDEAGNCTIIDYEVLSKCPHSYFPTPDGPQCLCDPNNKNSSNLCAELKNCTGENLCQQRCSKYKEKVMCSCYDDYIEIPGTKGFKCRNKNFYGNTLVYSTSNQIKSMNLTTYEVSVVQKNVECGVLVAAHDYVYYTSYEDDNKFIFKTSINSEATIEGEVTKSESPIISMAIDYITNNIYFTSNTSLSVCTNDGRICIKLKCCDVSYVALAPLSGLMFFTKKSHYNDERFIMKSNLDGSDESVLIDGTFRDPVPLVVEESSKKIFFLETTHNIIHSASFDSNENNDVQFVKLHGTMVSFTAHGGRLYFTKSRDNEIYTVENIERFTKRVKNEVRLVYRTLGLAAPGLGLNEVAVPLEMLSDYNATQITDNKLTFAIRNLYAFNPLLQKPNIENPCTRSSCSGLCLLQMDYSDGEFDQVCLCDDFTPVKGNNWCVAEGSNSREEETVAVKTAAISTEKHTSSSSSHSHWILTTLFIIVILGLVFVTSFVAFKKFDCYGYYDMIRSRGQNRNSDRIDIYNGEDL